MYDYEQIEDSLRFCDRKIYRTDADYQRQYSESEKQNWEQIAEDIISRKDAKKDSFSSIAVSDEDITYSDIAAIYRKKADEYISIPKRLFSNMVLLALCVFIAFGAAHLFIDNVAFQSTVEGTSMLPTLENDDSLIIDKFSYVIGSPKRYDIVVFPVKEEKGKQDYFIKRIIALPGETVSIDDGRVYINGTPLKSDKYGKESIKDAGLASVPQTLAQDEYFVLGDNRNMSTDSRNEIVGLVKRKDIVGKAVFRILPFGEFGGLN